MGILSATFLTFVVAPLAVIFVARSAVRRREGAQKLLTHEHAHLRPKRTWPVAFASGEHMETILKLLSWQDVGVLHLYEEAITFYGERSSFEIERASIEFVGLSTYVRTHPLVPWIEIRTTGGNRYFFCLPRGIHVFGMRARAEEVYRTLEEWSRGSTGRPLLIE